MFPDSSEKSDIVKIRGPKQDVDAAFKHLQKLYKELVESSYSVKVLHLGWHLVGVMLDHCPFLGSHL